MVADSSTEMPNLEHVLAYQNEAVVGRFMRHFDVSEREAAEIFQETKKWLWLCAVAGKDAEAPDLFIDGFIGIIDQMWHNFILFTRDYHRFCHDYLTGFVDHYPVAEGEHQEQVAAYKKDRDTYLAEQAQKYRQFYAYIYDHLGEETLKRWMVDYSEKYTPDYLKQILRKP